MELLHHCKKNDMSAETERKLKRKKKQSLAALLSEKSTHEDQTFFSVHAEFPVASPLEGWWSIIILRP